ncbi:hypothetical protein NBRC111894_2676 [Sporolactobacillus inulinus]|uniref:Uncharacterized protein n=1 Tax=Sporolactobacillus inulinus TaxID=2078 RepID=A0A4Y1ZDE4_9BACL|nr:hypothetical protein NBRC111894_2676 [Sporolactobacillus inulinus]
MKQKSGKASCLPLFCPVLCITGQAVRQRFTQRTQHELIRSGDLTSALQHSYLHRWPQEAILGHPSFYMIE